MSDSPPVPLSDEVHALRERFLLHNGHLLTWDELKATAAAFLAEAERMHLACKRQSKRAQERIDAWVAVADTEREAKERYLAAFTHTHVAWGDSDACRQCGLDLRDPIHRRVGQ